MFFGVSSTSHCSMYSLRRAVRYICYLTIVFFACLVLHFFVHPFFACSLDRVSQVDPSAPVSTCYTRGVPW